MHKLKIVISDSLFKTPPADSIHAISTKLIHQYAVAHRISVIHWKNVKFPCPGNVQYGAEFPVL